MDSLLRDLLSGAPRPDWSTLCRHWSPLFDWLEQLAHTPQDPEWHGEGDVYIHTGLVLERLDEEIAAAPRYGIELTPQQRASLIVAAALHDIGKSVTTRSRIDPHGTARLSAPRHADRGRSYCVLRLTQLGLAAGPLTTALDLIGHHHDPLQLVRTDAPPHRYRQLARHADLRLLYLLERADLRGRICRDGDEQLELLELFRLGCEEADAWQTRTPYGDPLAQLADQLAGDSLLPLIRAMALRDLEAGEIFTAQEAIARAYRLRERPSHLVLLVGPSGSGKSSWVAEQPFGGEAQVISLDELRAERHGDRANQREAGQIAQAAKEQLRVGLRAGKTTLWDATNLSRDRRSALIGLARAYGAATTIVAFRSGLDALFQRNAQRGNAKVSHEVLARQLERLDWPYAYEADTVLEVGPDGLARLPWPGE